VTVSSGILACWPAGLLASAVGRPQAGFGGVEAYESLWLKVAALLESVARNHAFLDGNKRTAIIAAIHMLNLNGYDLVAEQCEIVDLALDTVEGALTLQKIAEFIEQHAQPLKYPEID